MPPSPPRESPCVHFEADIDLAAGTGKPGPGLCLALAALLALALPTPAEAQSAGCNCFPPEVQAQTAREALQKSSLAVYARVAEVDAPSGRLRLVVLESFKGPPKDTVIQVLPATSACAPPSSSPGDERLLLVFDDAATACDLHPPEHYLLGAFRALAAGPR